jgi:predicted CXXCH cytochrome family protein
VKRNYRDADNGFNTTFSEINVACEACHGPGARHIALAEAERLEAGNSGLTFKSSGRLNWEFEKDNPIAVPKGEASQHEIDTCGACHALRRPLTDETGDSLDNTYAVQFIHEPAYFPNGEIREEVFVLGSFLQSRMHMAGVICTDCHDPHSGSLLIEGNALCGQCHRSDVFDTEAHQGLLAGSEGAACVNCHMPARTYMQVDDRRDHSFVIPGRERPSLADDDLSPHWRGSLLAEFTPVSNADLGVIRDGLNSPEPLVRRGAVRAAARLPPQLQLELLTPLLSDANRSVRTELASVLVDVMPQVSASDRRKLMPLMEEYRQMLEVTREMPTTQLSLGALELALGNTADAEQAFRQALRIEPDFVPALLNVADYYRSTGRDNQSEALLRRAVEIMPESSAANHSLGLYLVRKRNYEDALRHLAAAAEGTDASPRFAYVYAVALENLGRIDEGIEVLTRANLRWPNQYDVLLTLVTYLEKSGSTMSIRRHVRDLVDIAPTSPEVQRYARRYL